MLDAFGQRGGADQFVRRMVSSLSSERRAEGAYGGSSGLALSPSACGASAPSLTTVTGVAEIGS
jgi:hypothetical protein